MARIRTIKPEFFTSDTVSTLPVRARLTWIGLWTHCDDYGRCRNNVKLIKAAVWPLDDVSLRDVAEDLDALENAGLIFKYEVAGKSYLQVRGWAEHQKVDRPSRSNIPAPPDNPPPPPTPSRDTRETLASPREGLDLERKGTGNREGNARAHANREPSPTPAPGPEPPQKCPKHVDDPAPPRCGACADARKAHDRWQADQQRADQARRSAEARARAEAAAAAIRACRLCDQAGRLPSGVVCTHDPARVGSTGAARARAALTRKDTTA